MSELLVKTDSNLKNNTQEVKDIISLATNGIKPSDQEVYLRRNLVLVGDSGDGDDNGNWDDDFDDQGWETPGESGTGRADRSTNPGVSDRRWEEDKINDTPWWE